MNNKGKIEKRGFRKFTRIVLFLMILGFISISFTNFRNRDFELTKNLDIYHTLFRELNIYYVDKIDPGKLVKTSIDKMLLSLDPYTSFIPESDIEDYKMMFTGEYGGIGALIRKSGDNVIISEPYENFPAQKSGIKAGDIIHEIDGISVIGKSSADVSQLLKSQTKSTIKIVIERPGKSKKMNFEFQREKIRIDNVPYYGMINNVAYIRLTGFTQNAGNEIRNSLINLKENNKIQSVILDLRGNPGGLLIEAVNIMSLFVDKGLEIVTTRGKVNQWNKTYRSAGKIFDKNIPVSIIVNRTSASASEIVAGAMQDLDRGIIIGQKTFGKGLVQTSRKLSYNTQLKLTTAKYYIPSGRCIQALDYSNRNEDGSVGNIPDSLISEYTTKAGRKVFDGGGIVPDISMEAKFYSRLSTSLVVKNLVFDFATEYASKNEKILPANEFSINEKDYEQFIDFIKNRDFIYDTESEKTLDKLVENAKKEKYFVNAENEIEALRKKLKHNQLLDMNTYKNEIIELLNSEIASRYYYRRGRIESLIQNDAEIKRAINIMSNREEYDKILSGS